MAFEPNILVIAEAYAHLRVIQNAFQNTPGLSWQADLVREALTFLTHIGRSKVRPGYIDCSRCLLYALDVLRQAPDPFVEQYDGFWGAYGALMGEVLRRNGHIEIVEPALRIGWFLEKYQQEGTSWPARANIIAGFAAMASQDEYRSDMFWEVANHFLRSCRDGVREDVKNLRQIRETIIALLNFWWNLANSFGRSYDVRQRLATAADSLLQIIVDARLGAEWLNRWKGTLFGLELRVSDPLKEERLPTERQASIQDPLSNTAKTLDRLRAEHYEVRLWLTDVQDHLIPYLHGRREHPTRVAPRYVQCEAVFRSSGTSPEILRKVRICDICQRTRRGFRIEVPDLPVFIIYDHHVGLNDKTVDGRLCRTIISEENTIEEVVLFPQYATGDGDVKVATIICQVLRVWPLQEAHSGWALLAPENKVHPRDWFSYVQGLGNGAL
jgi:hypothetical protein